MITKFENKFDFTKETSASVLEVSDLAKKTNSIKLRIPIYMSNIESGTAKQSVFTTKGLSIFVSETRPAITSSVLKTQNFLSASLYDNSHMDNLKLSAKISNNKLNYNIKKGSTVRAYFLNNKISKLTFNIDSNSSTKTVMTPIKKKENEKK